MYKCACVSVYVCVTGMLLLYPHDKVRWVMQESLCWSVCHVSGFVQKTSSELINLLPPNLIWWCITVGHGVMQKKWVAIFKVKVTMGII